MKGLNDLIDISNNNYREVLYRLDSYKNGGNIYTNTELNISKAVKLLKNNDIKDTLVNTLSKYTDYKEDYVVLDMYNTLTPDMEKILDDSLNLYEGIK